MCVVVMQTDVGSVTVIAMVYINISTPCFCRYGCIRVLSPSKVLPELC